MKVLLILVDGMRPDVLYAIPEAKEMMEKSSYSLKAQTVFPSITLPCHMSLFHSIDPSRHGTTTNVYAPQVRPVQGLCEILRAAKKRCAFFYSWQELRDLVRPDSLAYGKFVSGHTDTYECANVVLTDDAISYIKEYSPDFSFLYLGWTDDAGHQSGWMSQEYMRSVEGSWKEIKRITDTLSDDFVTIILADHGGHDRIHGTNLPEDMTIPIIVNGGPFLKGNELENINIIDIAPTIATLLDVSPAPEWEGRNLCP